MAAGKLTIDGQSSCPTRAQVERALKPRIAQFSAASRIAVALEDQRLQPRFRASKDSPELSRAPDGGKDECDGIVDAAPALLDGWLRDRLSQQPARDAP